MQLRSRIEAAFTHLGRVVVRRRWLAILACALTSAVLMARLPELRVDNSDEAFLHADDPARIVYDRFKEQFDREDRVLVVLGPTQVFEPTFLETLRRLHREIEHEVPYVEEVTSLVNARHTRAEGDELVVEDLMEEWPQTPAQLSALRERAMANPLYIDALVTADASHTVISLEPFTYSTLGDEETLAGFDDDAGAERRAPYLTDVEGFALVEKLEQVVSRYASPQLEIHLVGGPTFDRQMATMLQRDASVLMSLSLVVVLVTLFVLFRRVSAVLLPVTVVASAMLSSLGFMVWLDIPFSVTLNMLPGFLLVVGVCDSIHILTLVYKRLAAGRSKQDAIVDALGHSGLAVLMTSVTTAAGLASFSLAELAPIAQLGIVAPVGVMLALLYSLVLLPALLAVFPIGAAAATAGGGLRDALDRLLARVGDVATRHPRRVVVATALVLLLGLPGLLRVRFSHDGMRWFPEEDPLKQAVSVLDREFKGASGLEVLVHTGRVNALYEPDLLQRIERAMRHAVTLRVDGRPIAKATSIVDVVKETHQALNENRREFHRIPDDRELVAQELLLFENSGTDDMEEVTNTQLETARVSLRVPWTDAMAFPALLDELRSSFREILGGDVELELTGGVVLFTSVFNGVIRSMASSYVFALLVITPLMVALIGDLRRGLAAMIPNLVPIYLVLALMGWTGIPLDASTLLIGGVILGLAVDDTIHFMHKWGRYYADTGDARFAVHETLATTGTAMLFTSLVLVCGFAVMLAAYMTNAYWFGLLAGFATGTAFLADIVLGPALMVLVSRQTRPASMPQSRAA
jgi:hydrophobe/amphiphile efflux-3 (HAE3) family protein